MGLSGTGFYIMMLAAFPLPCPYTQFAPFFRNLVKCRAGGRPQQWLSSAWAPGPNIEWAWAWAANSLAPQVLFYILKKSNFFRLEIFFPFLIFLKNFLFFFFLITGQKRIFYS